MDRPDRAAEWDALADRVGAPTYMRPGWFAAWWRAFGAGTLEVRELRRDGRLAGVLPLARRGGRLHAPANAHTPAFAPVAEDAEAAAVLMAGAVTGGRRARFSHLEAPARAAAVAAAEAAGVPVHASILYRSPVIALAEPSARPSRRVRAGLRRRRRRLEERGAVTFAVERGDRELDALLEAGFALEAKGWKGAARTAVRPRPVLWRFYRDIAAWAAARGDLRLYFLRLDGAPIAFDFALDDGAAVHLLKTGFDPDHAACSPGSLLLGEIVEHARADGRRSVELLGGDEPYKLDWTDVIRERSRLEVFPPTPLGRLGRAVHARRRDAIADHPGLAAGVRELRDGRVLPALEALRRR